MSEVRSQVREYPCGRCTWIALGALFLVSAMSIPLCAEDASLRKPIRLDSREVSESSGLVFSRRDPNCVWTHNDSGDRARLWCFDARTGRLTGKCELLSAEAVDWESITAGKQGDGQLIIADSGDNLARRKFITLYRIGEPDPHRTTLLTSGDYEVLHVRYPGGPVDCEAVWYDEPRSRIILLTKGRLPFAFVYAVPDDRWQRGGQPNDTQGKTTGADDNVVTARRIATIGLPMATGADRDPRNGDVWVASYFQAFCFPRGEHPSLIEQLMQTPTAYDMPKLKQIEGIALDTDSHVWVSSEGTPAMLAPIADATEGD